MSLRDYFSNNKIFTGTEKPTQGKFDVGDIIVNIGPNSAEEPMWICVEAGTPGVWELCSGVNEDEIADIVQANALSAVDYTDGVDIQIDGGEIGNMNELQTTDKSSIVGAINELFQSANNGKELIASAIGEPLSSEDAFSAMSTDINSLLSTFKTNMMNSGVTVESGDKFKSLIDKIKGLTEGEGNKGIQFAEGTLGNLSVLSGGYQTNTNVTMNLDFIPNYIFINMNYTINNISGNPSITNMIICNMLNQTVLLSFGGSETYSFSTSITDLSSTGFTINISGSNYGKLYVSLGEYYAIGVGEEDTTLKDSLASILTEEGVGVTEEDDMASLISKTDNQFNSLNTTITLLNNQVNSLTSELSGKVAPAGTAIAGDVLTGKTFINSTGQTITGTMANNGTKTITPKASAQTLGAGYYDKITINGDADLVAANIVSGKNIFGVTGTAVVQTTVKAGNTYYMVDNITMTALDSIRKYGGYLNASDYMVNNNNYILYKYNSPVTGKVRISYNISSESKHYKHQLKVYNKSGTVTWKSTELVITSGSIITNDISVEIGGLIEVCWLGNNYGQSTGVTAGPSKTKIENICITYSL